MKYLPLRDFDIVTNALNFSTPDCHILGSCDLYTTKAAGGDKKLYKNIEHTLETQYESLVRLSASLSPPCTGAGSDDGNNGRRGKRSRTVEPSEIDLSRASPFGPLSQIGARRTFAYLIATLNASHPDYDFSHLLRPSDFKKERSLRTIMYNIDSTLQHLRPKPFSSSAYLSPPLLPEKNAPALSNSLGSEIWGPRMWSLIDKEMGLRQCEKYSYVPDEDPFDEGNGGEGPSLWCMHYFFFNKEKKRVCYLYLRALSVISHSPVHAPLAMGSRSKLGRKRSKLSVGDGAGKRASYWLGTSSDDIDTSSYGDDDDDEVVQDPQDDEIEVPHMDLDDIRSDLADGCFSYAADYEDGYYNDDFIGTEWEPVSPVSQTAKAGASHHVRGPSEEIADVMEI
ncbi:repressor of RNA polymerase III transcription MAF1 [Teratosphaeria nubilosa]|uniref:Repressor of RNA polymerase III transcription MAF1 n=1 Tax=Teratosphaeria nubilosa TaxID=161662 RepID=A0A6G1LNI9_9PEZI|nr:repressor of RNA polymerase III transcription MAF1 [Teratosphaeria nubilosa]